MKIFPATQNSAVAAPKASSKKAGISRKKAALPEKKELSADAIKEKLAAHVQTSGTAKTLSIKNTKPLGAGFMNEAIVTPPEIVPLGAEAAAPATPEEMKAKKDHLLRSDVSTNDPNDTNTQEKLKTVLSRGAFNFTGREKEVLEKILA